MFFLVLPPVWTTNETPPFSFLFFLFLSFLFIFLGGEVRTFKVQGKRRRSGKTNERDERDE